MDEKREMKKECSFCNKTVEDLKFLIIEEHDRAAICDSCISICIGVLSERGVNLKVISQAIEEIVIEALSKSKPIQNSKVRKVIHTDHYRSIKVGIS